MSLHISLICDQIGSCLIKLVVVCKQSKPCGIREIIILDNVLEL
jgi:predicted metal-binding transcription factor (methanogenesis marker protein 9)